MITCPAGLVFSAKTGICTWPDQAGKTGCSSRGNAYFNVICFSNPRILIVYSFVYTCVYAELFQFDCPKVNETFALTHPRYADPEDCQFFYVCINGDTPRRNGCKLGQAFNADTKHCEWARTIPECADWYKDQLTDAQLDELENPKPPTKTRVKGPSKRKSQQQQRD